MALSDFFIFKKKSTANIAKKRLQIIVTERRINDNGPAYLSKMKYDVLQAICKYVQIDPEMLTIQFEYKNNEVSVLELNVTFIEPVTGHRGNEEPSQNN